MSPAFTPPVGAEISARNGHARELATQSERQRDFGSGTLALDRAAAPALDATAPTPDFVFYLSADWETFHRPDMLYAFARRIARGGGRLLCVDRLMCALTGPMRGVRLSLGGPSKGAAKWARCLARCATRRGDLVPLAENFHLLRAVQALDDRFALRLAPAAALNRALVRAQVRSAMRRLGMDARLGPERSRPLVSWFYFPWQEHYAGLLGEALRVYECCDQHVANPGARGGFARRIGDAERRLFANTDLVFVTSDRLRQAKRELHRDIVHVPNGADFTVYSRVQDPALAPDPEIAALPRPIVGYLGTIHEHTDLPLVRWLAERRPEWSFVLAGKLDQRQVAFTEDFQRLAALPNVRVLGWVPRERLLPIAKCFDVGIIPYRQDSEFNRFVNPNKLHEYTAMGKPVVASAGIDADSHREWIEQACTPRDFMDAIERAWRGDGPERIAERLRVARENSWDARVDVMMRHVGDRLEHRASQCAAGQIEPSSLSSSDSPQGELKPWT